MIARLFEALITNRHFMDKSKRSITTLWDTVPIDQHPVYTRRYTVITPAINEANKIEMEWMRRGFRNGNIVAGTRVGKSKFRRIFADYLKANNKRMSPVSISARLCENFSERVFYGLFLNALRLSELGWTEERRERLLQHLILLADQSGFKRVVLLIDEAEYLKDAQFHWLLGLYNDLEDVDIQLFTSLFGRPELLLKKAHFQETNQTQLVSRFFEAEHEFRGVRSAAEIKAILHAFDDEQRFPEGTEWTYTKYFFPGPYEQGWRLAEHASTFWSAFEQIYRVNSSKKLEIPTKFVFRAIEQFLLSARLWTRGELRTDLPDLVNVVRETGFGNLEPEPKEQADKED